MSASASAHPLAPSLLVGQGGGSDPLAHSLGGLVEAQRPKQRPRLQGDGLVGRFPTPLPLPEGVLLGAHRVSTHFLSFDLSSGKATR